MTGLCSVSLPASPLARACRAHPCLRAWRHTARHRPFHRNRSQWLRGDPSYASTGVDERHVASWACATDSVPRDAVGYRDACIGERERGGTANVLSGFWANGEAVTCLRGSHLATGTVSAGRRRLVLDIGWLVAMASELDG